MEVVGLEVVAASLDVCARVVVTIIAASTALAVSVVDRAAPEMISGRELVGVVAKVVVGDRVGDEDVVALVEVEMLYRDLQGMLRL